MGSISQSTGRRFYKNRHHRAFLWWEVGNVCLMPIRKVRLCGMGRPRNCIRRNKRGYINYWEPWYLGYYPPPWESTWSKNGHDYAKGIYPKLRKEGYDLHELHALMAPRPFLVSGGTLTEQTGGQR